MPRRTVPTYSKHKATGQARVRIDGKDHYLGLHGSKESHERYSALIADWLARQDKRPSGVDVGRLALLYLEHAKQRYRKNGQPTSEIHGVRAALKYLLADYRRLPVSDLSPRVVRAARSKMIDDGLARTTINALVAKIRRMVRWGVGEELVAASVLVAVEALTDLRKDEAGRECPPVGPVPDAFIETVEAHLAAPLWGAIRFQVLTGARPGEALRLRGCDLQMTGEVWLYTPSSHKTEHHGRTRTICIGPAAQNLLQAFLTPNLQSYVFGTDHSQQAKPYRRDSYTTAVARACRAAKIPVWSPNQLRHNFATKARKEFGIEAARVTLGHVSAVTSEIYAERDLEAARVVAAKIG